ncbi:reticulocyte-binding protein 2 homolog a-like [Puntigrus tetrazona]|uniref:reticulocyte-binding protein 2 homolog a-like n=1 Tax=Puntigrus tetrazona TaxID=1606681 RepID=UPI001C8B00D9|nr:reticulocyte-binding protein 2 homolog a-like [Puntigrus tetrazona]
MNCNEFRKLRLQTCARAQQHTTKMSNITTISSRMQTVKLPPIHGASPAGGRTKQGKKSGSSLERDDRNAPHQEPRSKTILPQLSVQKTKCQSISEYNEDIRKAARLNGSGITREEAQIRKKGKALQRKICRVEDIKEIEEMQWKEDDERKTEEDRTRHLDSERLYFKNKRLMSKKEEKKKLFQDNRDEKKKYERNRVHMEEEIQRLTLCIQEKHKEYNQVKANLEMANKKRVSRRIRKRAENKKLCEELGKVTESYGLPDFWDVYPLITMLHLEECISVFLDSTEHIPPEDLCKLQKQICKQNKDREQKEERLRREALFEERRQKRLERSLSQPLRVPGKKLMPRTQPSNNIRKKLKPVETKKMNEDLYAYFLE